METKKINIVDNTQETEYKHVYFGGLFTFDKKDYIKTNFQRGYFRVDERKIFKSFKKNIIVTVNHPYYN